MRTGKEGPTYYNQYVIIHNQKENKQIQKSCRRSISTPASQGVMLPAERLSKSVTTRQKRILMNLFKQPNQPNGKRGRGRERKRK